MNTNIKIDDSLLADYILGLLQPDVEAHIWSELQKDPNLMLRYQGLKGIKLMHPDRDPEEVLDEKVAELQAFAQNLIAKKKTASQNHLAIEKVETQNPIAAKKEAIPKVFLLNKYFRAAIIIGVVTCLSIVTYQLMQPQKQSPGNLAALSPTQIIKNKEAEINWTDDNVRGEMDDETAKWQDAANHSNFQLAINLLQNKQNRTPAEQFYLGFFYLKLNQFLMAEIGRAHV